VTRGYVHLEDEAVNRRVHGVGDEVARKEEGEVAVEEGRAHALLSGVDLVVDEDGRFRRERRGVEVLRVLRVSATGVPSGVRACRSRTLRANSRRR
jgi:hypothetical protein